MTKRNSFFGMPIRIIKKGKTVGRPSKFEKTASKLMSWYFEQPEVKEVLKRAQEDMILHGFAIIPQPILKSRP